MELQFCVALSLEYLLEIFDIQIILLIFNPDKEFTVIRPQKKKDTRREYTQDMEVVSAFSP